MNNKYEPPQLRLRTDQEPEQFMTSEEYRIFWEDFIEKITPGLKRQEEERRKSEEKAHLEYLFSI